MKLKYFSILDFVVLKYLWLQKLPQSTLTARWYCAGFEIFPLSSFSSKMSGRMKGTSVTSICRWVWCSHRDFYHLLNFHWLLVVNSVLHLKCKSQQLLYLVNFKFSFVICQLVKWENNVNCLCKCSGENKCKSRRDE